jgi:hypothetical protein
MTEFSTLTVNNYRYSYLALLVARNCTQQ